MDALLILVIFTSLVPVLVYSTYLIMALRAKPFNPPNLDDLPMISIVIPAFNEEVVADAIFSMHTPVVSAVGHEVDVLISDFVADLRAPTPSAAIEMILPDSQEILYTLDELIQRYRQNIEHKLNQSTQTLKHLEEILLRSSPLRRLSESQEEFKRLEEEFKRVIDYRLERFEVVLPEIKKSLEQNIHFIIQQKEQHLEYINKKIEMNDPQLQCKKGWAQLLFKGKTITLNELQVNDTFTLEDASVKIEAVCLKKMSY